MKQLPLLVIPIVSVLAGWIATSASSELPKRLEPTEPPWVRTVHGWERAHWLAPSHTYLSPPLHPTPVATGLLFAAVTVLGLGHVRGMRTDRDEQTVIVIDRDDRL
jgi:hypothetical protein